MANTKISALTATTSPTGGEELVYAYNNANGKMTLDTMKTFASAGSQPTLVSGTNIKTINGNDILGSGNLVISGGGGGITTLNADANIWELADGIYETEYDLYYMTGQEVPRGSGSGLQFKQMISVAQSAGGTRGFMVINSRDRTGMGIHGGWAFYGYSNSSAEGVCNQLGPRDYVFKYALETISETIDSINEGYLTQIVNAISDGINDLRISVSNPPYPGLTYTFYITSVANPYSITLGTGVTNPFGISLPNNSSKGCIITVLVTSTTTGIVTSCTMMP